MVVPSHADRMQNAASSGGACVLDHKHRNGLQGIGGSMSVAMASARELLLGAWRCAQQVRRGTWVHGGAEATRDGLSEGGRHRMADSGAPPRYTRADCLDIPADKRFTV